MQQCESLLYDFDHEFSEKCGKSKYSNMAITETSGQWSGFDGFANSSKISVQIQSLRAYTRKIGNNHKLLKLVHIATYS